MFDWKKPTVQMLGRWQPWHEGHQALFKRCVAKTGQVIIQVRDVQGASGGKGQDDNPFDWDQVCKNIEDGLIRDNFILKILKNLFKTFSIFRYRTLKRIIYFPRFYF